MSSTMVMSDWRLLRGAGQCRGVGFDSRPVITIELSRIFQVSSSGPGRYAGGGTVKFPLIRK
jgi:hypothetical protein